MTQEPRDYRFLSPDEVPDYPSLGAKVARLRAAARRDPSKRKEHGDAVIEAVRDLHAKTLQRTVPDRPCHCASGTSHNTGEAILRAVRGKQSAALARALQQDHAARTDKQVRALYEEAMRAKRAAAEAGP